MGRIQEDLKQDGRIRLQRDGLGKDFDRRM